MNYVTTNSKGITVPLYRVGVPAEAFPTHVVLKALGLPTTGA